jgi:lipopolysaccharide export system protein LptA
MRDYSVFSGQVDVRQDDVRILSDVMKVYSGQGGSGQQAFDNVQRIEALGNFYYITPEQEVKGDQGVYERAKDNFIVTGNVILLQGEDNVVTGDRLVYNLSNNKAVMTGSCKGRRCGRNGRVNILIKNTNGQR